MQVRPASIAAAPVQLPPAPPSGDRALAGPVVRAGAAALDHVQDAAKFGVGAAVQGANIVARKVEGSIPNWLLVSALADADLVVLQDPAMHRGAEFTNRVVGRHDPATVDYDALRTARPLLSELDLRVAAPTDAHELVVRLDAPTADWRDRARGAGNVAVYVDGRYHSDMLALSERDTPNRVNLAGLAAGTHHVELRWSGPDLSGPSAPPVTVRSVEPRQLTAQEALIARFAPILETRVPGSDVDQRPMQTDVPMVLAPTVAPLPGGGTRITYDVLFSNEDGGIPIGAAYASLGRSLDLEIAYRVDLDAAGNRVADMFQGPVHVPYQFQGERMGDRPILRVATRNNMFTSQLTHATPRWSESPIAASAARRSDRELLVGNPWTGAMMGKETVREGKITLPGAKYPVWDARSYLYLGSSDLPRIAYERDKSIGVVLRDGSVVELDEASRKRVMWSPLRPPMGTAIRLPDGVASDDVIAIRVLGRDGMPLPRPGQAAAASTFVLDGQYRPRVLGF